jgi:hypothetical protein
VPPKHEKTDVPPKHSLINQHMMLAGFAIENLCRGYLAGRLSHKEREDVQRRCFAKILEGSRHSESCRTDWNDTVRHRETSACENH